MSDDKQTPIWQPSDAQLLSGEQTLDYFSFPWAQLLTVYVNKPWFGLLQMRTMLLDQQVWFGQQLRNAMLLQAKFEVKGPSPEVNAYVQEQWDRFWIRNAIKVATTRYYGYAGFEVLYSEKDGEPQLEGLKDFAPHDVRPIRQNAEGRNKGKIAGVGVHGQRRTMDGKAGRAPDFLFGGKGLWLTYQATCGSAFGQSSMAHSYPAWWDKAMPGGAYDLRRLRAIKDAWRGDVLRYPSNWSVMRPDGTKITGKDIVREIGELVQSGGVITLPSDVDPLTLKPLFEYEPPQTVADSSMIKDWIEDADWDIFDGLLIPREIVEAAASGGFSGRSFPFVMFAAMGDIELLDYTLAIKHQVMEPRVIRKFGEKANDFEVVPIPLIDTMGEKMGGQEMGGPIGGTASQGPPQQQRIGGPPQQQQMRIGQQPAQQPQKQPEAMQFSAINDSEPYEFSSTQFNLNYNDAKEVEALRAIIDEADLHEKGFETQPHITVLYGLEADTPDDVAMIVSNRPAIAVRLGKTSVFEGEEYDVVKVDVHGWPLHSLRNALAFLPYKSDYPNYQPHLTLAYVKPGTGYKYADLTALEGMPLVFETICFSDKNRNHVEIPFGGLGLEQFSANPPGTRKKAIAANMGLEIGERIATRMGALLKKN